MNYQKPIAIIGAGLSGLSAANLLHREGIPFTVYEGSNKVAGLAASFKDEEGFIHDFGAHWTTNRLADRIGISDQCRTVKHYSESVWLKGKYYKYPFGLLKIGRMFKDGVVSKLQMGKQEPASAAEWFQMKYGQSLANEVGIPLVEAWSGANANDLAPSVSNSLPGSILNTFFLKVASKVTGRAVAIGYNRELPEKPSVYHVYPEDGIATLCQKLSEGFEDKIKTNSPVEEILVEDNRVVAIKTKGQTKEVSAVINTAPVHVLGRLIRGSEALDYLKKFRYRAMLFVNLKLKGRGLLPDMVTWFPEKDFPFFRLTEATISMPWLAPEGKTMVTVDIGCHKGDQYWNMSDEELTEMCLSSMETIIPDIRDRYLGSSFLKTTTSYPIFLKEYESERQRFEKGLGIENLVSTGRNGEFLHIFMEDVYLRTRRKVQGLLKELAGKQLVIH